MKKIMILLAVVGMLSLQGCTTTNDANYVDNDTISTVFENKVAYNFAASNDYVVKFNFPRAIYYSDMVLVYRLTGTFNGNDLWEFLPETHYFADGTRYFSYNFDFTKNDVQIYLDGNALATVDGKYRLNQFFRIVVVPANIVYSVDKSDLAAVMAAVKNSNSKMENVNF